MYFRSNFDTCHYTAQSNLELTSKSQYWYCAVSESFHDCHWFDPRDFSRCHGFGRSDLEFFWVQLETSVSVIAVCPTAYRSLFLIKNSPKHMPHKPDPNRIRASVLGRVWRRKNPSLASVNVGATLAGMSTLIRDNLSTQHELHDDDGCALSSIEVQSSHSGLNNHEATKLSGKT